MIPVLLWIFSRKGSLSIRRLWISFFLCQPEMYRYFKLPKSITDIYYILRRSIRNEEEVRKLIRILFTLFDVKDTFSTDCELALNSPMEDYEDAIMVQTASRIGADCIVTRNLKDYCLASLPVFSPEQFLSELAREENNGE